MPTALVRNAHVVTAAEEYDADLYVDAGRVALIGQSLSLPADTVIDASGLLLLPGGVDVHTHLDMPAGPLTSADDFETGTRAAAFGGTTTVVDFATPEPGQSLLSALETWRRKAEGRACVDYGFHMALREVTDATLSEMARLVREGVSSFKLYLAYPGVLQVDDGAFFRALQQARECGALTLVHAENGDVIDVLVKQALARGETAPVHHALTHPAALEAEATARAIALAALAQAPLYVVHLTLCRGARPRGRRARSRPGRLRRDLPAVPVPVPGRLRAPRRGRLRDLAPVARDLRPGGVVGRPGAGRAAGRGHRPLPVHASRQGPRPRRLLADPERRARHRDAAAAAVGRACARGASTRGASSS